MKKKLITLFGVIALAVVPAVYAAAQEMDEAKDIDEAPGWQAGHPGGRMNEGAPMMKRGAGGNEGMMGRKGLGGGPGSMQEEEILAMIKKYEPAFAEKMESFKTAAPIKYKMMLMMGGRMLSGSRFEADVNMEKDAVRSLSLEYDTKELESKYNKAADADKPAVKAALKVKVSELFDLRLKGQEARVGRMEKELAKLKKNLANKKANKARIVDERIGQLTGEGYGW